MVEVVYELRDVQQMYGERVVLAISHLTIKRGEILAIIGPSGAGKSTLLRLLNMLERPHSGTINFREHTFPPDPPLEVRRRITLVFQRPVLLDRTVQAVVGYGLGIRGKIDLQRAAAALEQVQLSHLANANCRTLSGGEAQRVALARALVLQPDVLLLDEPTANLDPANVALIEQVVGTTNANTGMTVVLVTHNVWQARRLAHRTALLLQGTVVEVGATEQVFSAPHDPRTGAFVRGEMVY